MGEVLKEQEEKLHSSVFEKKRGDKTMGKSLQSEVPTRPQRKSLYCPHFPEGSIGMTLFRFYINND